MLFAVIFLWTPPHTWALAMRYREDYAAAGVPMLPVVARRCVVARRSASTAWAMVAVSLLLVLAARRVRRALRRAGGRARRGVPARERTCGCARPAADAPGTPMRLFHWSITYLALLFLAVAVDQFV